MIVGHDMAVEEYKFAKDGRWTILMDSKTSSSIWEIDHLDIP
jgi:hypothetical protein